MISDEASYADYEFVLRLIGEQERDAIGDGDGQDARTVTRRKAKRLLRPNGHEADVMREHEPHRLWGEIELLHQAVQEIVQLEQFYHSLAAA